MRASCAVAKLLAVLASTGCIRRYAAPEGPAPTDTPYSGLALYRQIDLPVAEHAPPLPRAALRLAIDRQGAVFADAALVDGPEHPAITETWAGALALLSPRPEPIVLIAEPLDDRWCAALSPLRPRLHVAVRAAGRPLHPMVPRETSGESRDPLGSAPLEVVCAPEAVPALLSP